MSASAAHSRRNHRLRDVANAQPPGPTSPKTNTTPTLVKPEAPAAPVKGSDPADTSASASGRHADANEFDRAAMFPGELGGLSRMIAIALVVVATLVGSLLLLRWRLDARQSVAASAAAVTASPEGTAVINSHPDGAVVVIDGQTRGVTPLELRLPAGEHALEVQNGLDVRKLPLTVQSAGVSSQYIELPTSSDPDPKIVMPVISAGALEITSEPAGAVVAIDGQHRGTTPLSLKGVKAGRHDIIVTEGEASVRRSVVVSPGAHAVVDVSLASPGASAGWVRLGLPFDVRVAEDGRVLGTSAGDSVMVLAGSHLLELSNEALEFRTVVNVQVPPGKSVSVPVAVPNGSVSINATPWADVSVDGRSLGTTPLANLSLPLGRHEIVLRHPQFGERRQSITVTARTPVRLGMDLTK